jgi:UDP-N-acetylmuramate--alanine ligase
MFSNIKRVHFVGIGGIGMSGIAEILINMGFTVSGSDKNLSEITERLKKLGAKIYKGHSAANVKEVDVLVYSSAVHLDNPEIIRAQQLKIPVIRRAEMLAELMKMKYGIGIAGTHGKTTTTSMIGLILTEAKMDPTIIVGGKLSGLGGTNARLGQGSFIVVEADEFDRSFLQLTPSIAIITTLEREHLDIYSDLEDIKKAFIEYANKVPFYGFVVLCLDEDALLDIIPQIKKKIITYGLTSQSDLQAIDPKFDKSKSEFTLLYKGENLGKVELSVPGVHNIRNSMAAIATALELNVPFDTIKKAIKAFTGVFRRFEIKAEIGGTMIIDDYAHHPTEVAASLLAAKTGWKKRVIAVFQPHTYTRTRDFYQEFGKAFFNADMLVVTDVYPAREEPIQGVDGELIANAAKTYGHKNVHYIKDKKDIPDFLMKNLGKDDLIVTLGAGDIYKFGEELIAKLKNEKPAKKK